MIGYSIIYYVLQFDVVLVVVAGAAGAETRPDSRIDKFAYLREKLKCNDKAVWNRPGAGRAGASPETECAE